jgi:FkbM family methyltransferase
MPLLKLRQKLITILLIHNPVEYISFFGAAPKKLLHVGAHLAEEKSAYEEFGINEICWVEAQKEIYAKLIMNVNPNNCIHALVWSKKCVKELNIVQNSVSSSILKLDESNPWTEVGTLRKELYETVTLNDVVEDFRTRNLLIGKFLLLLDLQGAELEALKGLTLRNHNVSAISCEVSRKPIYLNSPKSKKITSHLLLRGYVPIISFLDRRTKHGDALYVKINELFSHPRLFSGAIILKSLRIYVDIKKIVIQLNLNKPRI